MKVLVPGLQSWRVCFFDFSTLKTCQKQNHLARSCEALGSKSTWWTLIHQHSLRFDSDVICGTMKATQLSFCPYSSLKKVRSAVNSALKTACQTTLYYRGTEERAHQLSPALPTRATFWNRGGAIRQSQQNVTRWISQASLTSPLLFKVQGRFN